MSDFLAIEVKDQAVRAWLETGLPARVHRAIVNKTSELTLRLESKIKNEKLSGQVLNVKTGNLRRSIFSQTTDEGDRVEGKVASSGDVKYAAIQEYGGQTPPHVIEAKGAALAFIMNGKQVFFKSVNHPGSKIPEHRYMRGSLEEMKPDIISGFHDAVAQASKP